MTVEEAAHLLLFPANRPPLSEVETAMLTLLLDLRVKYTELYLLCLKHR